LIRAQTPIVKKLTVGPVQWVQRVHLLQSLQFTPRVLFTCIQV
jgi:hypothetical protein